MTQESEIKNWIDHFSSCPLSRQYKEVNIGLITIENNLIYSHDTPIAVLRVVPNPLLRGRGYVSMVFITDPADAAMVGKKAKSHISLIHQLASKSHLSNGNKRVYSQLESLTRIDQMATVERRLWNTPASGENIGAPQ